MGKTRREQTNTRRIAVWICLALVGAAVALGAQDAEPTGGPVLVLTIQGDVSPALVEYIRRGIREGNKRDAELIVIRLNTPGGQLTSTRRIAEDMLGSKVPIAVHVWPSGAHAGSAGTFITMGAHVAAMAPATNIGAAHPVMMGGGGGGDKDYDGAEDEEEPDSGQMDTLMTKVTNDSVALIRNLADERGRNADWAERAVRESVVATATEALDQDIVDMIAADIDELLEQADGMKVTTPAGERTLHTAGAKTIDLDVSWSEKLLMIIAHPNIAYILMVIGMVGMVAELKSPGFGGAGIVGAICLILGLFALSVLDVSIASLALIVVGVAFLVAELFTPTYGLLTLGGTVSLTIGSLMLYSSPGLQVSRWLIAGVVFSTVSFFVFILGAVVKSQKSRVVTGEKGMLGQLARTRTPLDPEGTVFIEGALWTAESTSGPIPEGAVVEVVGVEGLRLTVSLPESE